jgi:hypothetical protein
MATVTLRIVGECLIEIGDRQLGPEAPHLFALMLYLAGQEGRDIPRAELADLLFPRATDSEKTAHNLSQLVYRLKQLGAPLAIRGKRVSVPRGAVDESLDRLSRAGRCARQSLRARDLDVLPSYDPHITTQYSDWLESLRAELANGIRRMLLADLDYWRTEQAWQAAENVARTLLALDDSNEQVIAILAEALFLSGRASEALAELDMFLAGGKRLASTAPGLQQLRIRIAKSRARAEAPQGSFRGQTDLIASLATSWLDVEGGTSRLSLVLGAPGAGKTRVASEFASHVRFKGGLTLSHRCDSNETDRPHALFRQLLPRLRSMRGSLGASPDLAQHLALLSAPASSGSDHNAAAAEATRNDILIAVVDLVEAVTSERPLLLVIDDAHFLDPASWSVVRAICLDQSKARVMMLACCRSNQDRPALSLGDRAAIHRIAPLSQADGRALLSELLPAAARQENHLAWCLDQAAGNPYFLHALARHGHTGDVPDTMPFDIARLASSLYYALDHGARSVLEACLFLGRFATMRRAQEVAGVDGGPLLAALRRLEDDGLLYFSGGELRFPHALLADALRTLVPTSVVAATHQRVAMCLETDSTEREYSAPMAWAAAESWLASGEASASTALLRQCAWQAAALGEHAVAARTLLRIPHTNIDLSTLSGVLEDAVTHAEVAGDRGLLFDALSALLETKKELNVPAEELQGTEFRVIEASLQQGSDPIPSLPSLLAFLHDDTATPVLRARAGLRLLAAADLLLDEELAHTTFEHLRSVLAELDDRNILRRQVELVFATVFGQLPEAIELVRRLLEDYPEPKLDLETSLARHYAAFALSRMGARELALPILRADYEYMAQRHVRSEALYSLILLAENAIADGAFADAHAWLTMADDAVRHGEPLTNYYYSNAAYFSAAANLAIIENRLDDAQALLSEANSRYPVACSPRLVSVQAALEVRLRVASGASVDHDPNYLLLQDLYAKGGHLGGQDFIVDTLWHALVSRGRRVDANHLLAEYLNKRRRERTRPEWLLSCTISSGDATRGIHQAMLPRRRHGRRASQQNERHL